LIREGKAKIVTDGVFYNPKMKFCRDADMIIFREMGSRDYLDALSATGIRGIRAHLEAGLGNVEFNDVSKRAVDVIRKNLKLNGISAIVHNRDAVSLMRERSYHHVDIDPFGSPSEFIDSACFSSKKFLSITATDTSALCGSSTKAGLRKYSAYAEKTEYYHEIGLRVLIGKIAREVTKYDKSIQVLVSWAKEHYYRVHLKVESSSKKAGMLYEKIGYILHCRNCGNRENFSMLEMHKERCMCGSHYRMFGPLWVGELHDPEFIKKLDKAGETGRLFSRIQEEMDSVSFFDVHRISEMLRISPPKLDDVLDSLKEAGFKASRTRFGGTSFKTDAGIEEIKRIIGSISQQRL